MIQRTFEDACANQKKTPPPVAHADLTGKTVLVTGANIGLGFEACKRFARMNPAKRGYFLTMRAHRVKNLTGAQIEEAVAVCCRAYTNPEDAITDVLMRCYTGDNFKLLQIYMRAMTRATLLEGQIFVATDGNTFPGPIRSVALCFPPGRGLFVTEEQKALGYNDFESGITSETRAWWDMLNKATHDFMDGLKLSYLFMDGVWVSMMATDREFQNRGFGTAVIQDIKAYAAADKWELGLMTHSESNHNWYASLGFRVAGVRNISAQPYENHFPCFAFAPYLPNDSE